MDSEYLVKFGLCIVFKCKFEYLVKSGYTSTINTCMHVSSFIKRA